MFMSCELHKKAIVIRTEKDYYVMRCQVCGDEYIVYKRGKNPNLKPKKTIMQKILGM